MATSQGNKIVGWITESGSGEVLALLRIFVGLHSLTLAALYLLHFDIFFSDPGLLNSTRDPITYPQSPSLLNFVSNPTTLAAFLLLLVVTSTCMVVGYCSRLMTIGCWILQLSLQNRSMMVACGGDILLPAYLFYLSLSSSGSVYSIDSWRNYPRKAALVSLLPQRLIAAHLVVLYLGSVLYKLLDRCWLDGSAVYYALKYHQYRYFPLPQWLTEPPFTTALTYGSLAIEGALVFIWFMGRHRSTILWLGVCLHVSIGYSLSVLEFSIATLIGYLSFLSDQQVTAFALSLRNKASDFLLLTFPLRERLRRTTVLLANIFRNRVRLPELRNRDSAARVGSRIED